MKPKPVNWELITNHPLYQMVQDLIDKYHGGKDSINGVNFVLMWRHNVKPDQDGYVYIADVTKSSDKMRELRPHDIVIGLNKIAWELLDQNQQELIIDCQLERIAVCVDKEGNQKEDDKARTIYRLRRLETIDDNTMLRRHGMALSDVQQFVSNKLTLGEAEEGSYVADKLTDPTL